MIKTPKYETLARHGYEPTPSDVRQACEKIRATWSPRERASRSMDRIADLITVINRERLAEEWDTPGVETFPFAAWRDLTRCWWNKRPSSQGGSLFTI